MQRYIDQVAIVTGAGSGIGRATATQFGQEGALVTLVDVAEAGVASLAAELSAAGVETLVRVCDVAERDAMTAVVADTMEAFGRIDVLHNNAAAVDATRHDTMLGETTPEIWQRTLDVNLTGVYLGCRAVLPEMLSLGGGAIVNTASINSLLGQPSPQAYGVSKAGVIGITKAIAVAYGRRGVRCNAVCPGQIMTPSAYNPEFEQFIEIVRKATPTGGSGQPADIAHAVCFLASKDAGYINGQCLAVDGGLSSAVPYWADVADLLAT